MQEKRKEKQKGDLKGEFCKRKEGSAYNGDPSCHKSSSLLPFFYLSLFFSFYSALFRRAKLEIDRERERNSEFKSERELLFLVHAGILTFPSPQVPLLMCSLFFFFKSLILPASMKLIMFFCSFLLCFKTGQWFSSELNLPCVGPVIPSEVVFIKRLIFDI